jgi:hypothetical protein
MQTLSPEAVAAVLAGLLSLAFTLIPGLNAKFAALEPDVKRAIMAGLSALIAVVIYVLSCTPDLLPNFPFSCPVGGVWQLITIIFLAVTVNQGVFAATPQPRAVKDAKFASGS